VQQLRLERSFSLLNLMNKLEAEAAETITKAEAEAAEIKEGQNSLLFYFSSV
jgi:hypothetical protein